MYRAVRSQGVLKVNEKNISNREVTDILRFLDQPLTEEELRGLAELLSENAEARKFYLDAIQLHLDLSSDLEGRQLAKKIFSEFPESKSSIEEAAGELPQDAVKHDSEASNPQFFLNLRRATSRLSLPYAAVIVFSCLCVGCGVGLVAASSFYAIPDFSRVLWSRKVESDVVARIALTHECQWQPSETPQTPPTRSLREGQQIRLESGFLQLVYRDGASVLLEGPAVFEVRSPSSGKLYEGKLSVTLPRASSGFKMETPHGVLLSRVGRIGAKVSKSGDEQIQISAGSGEFEKTVVEGYAAGSVILSPGGVLRIDPSGECTFDSGLSGVSVSHDLPFSDKDVFLGSQIPLGNLFDDSTTSSLTGAIESDTYQAAAETVDLGVASVLDGGLDIDVQLVDGGVWFNFANIGGAGPRIRGLPANDTNRSTETVPIQTRGDKLFIEDVIGSGKIEEGIGLHPNDLLTFDLDEIRSAGSLGDANLRFVVDRAGINDFGRNDTDQSHASIAVVVSDKDGVLLGFVNGMQTDVVERGGVFQFDVSGAKHIQGFKRGGPFVQFDVPLPPEAKFLSLAATMMEVEHDDHVVFSGARLVVERNSPQSSATIAQGGDGN